MRGELTGSPITVYALSGLFLILGVAIAAIDPLFLILSAYLIPQGVVGFSFWRVNLDEAGFSIERRGRKEFITFDQVKSVSRGFFGLPHIVLTLRPTAPIRRFRFFRDRSHGPFVFGDYHLKRRLEGIISSVQAKSLSENRLV